MTLNINYSLNYSLNTLYYLLDFNIMQNLELFLEKCDIFPV